MATGFGQKASETATSLMQEETRQQMKESVYSGLSSAQTNVAAGAGIAMEKGSEAFSRAGEATKETMDWTAENMKMGAGVVYESASNTMGAVSDKLDETGITEKAGQAAEKARAAGNVILATGAAGASLLNAKI